MYIVKTKGGRWQSLREAFGSYFLIDVISRPCDLLVIATRRSSPPGLPCLFRAFPFCKDCLFLLTSVWVWQSQNTSLRLQRVNTVQSMAPPVSLELHERIVALRYKLNMPIDTWRKVQTIMQYRVNLFFYLWGFLITASSYNSCVSTYVAFSWSPIETKLCDCSFCPWETQPCEQHFSSNDPLTCLAGFVRLPTPNSERNGYLNPNDFDESTSLKMSLFKPAEAPPTKLGRYRALSSTAGVHVSPLCLGAMVSTF